MRQLTLIRRFAALTPASLRARERGAVATIVALFLGLGVVLGFAALAIDVGSVMYERRQLQNGADASALALAGACGANLSDCTATIGTATATSLTSLNNANAADGAAAFDPGYYNPAPGSKLPGVCGRGIATLPACAAPNGTLGDCTPVPSGIAANPAIPYVEVHTLTKQSNGTNLLPRWITNPIVGQSTSGTAVAACSRAAWGRPGGSSSVPITFSMCEWRAATGSGASYYTDPVGSAPGYGGSGQPAWPTAATTPPQAPSLGGEIKIYLQSHGIPSSCFNWAGHDVPGGFGYLPSNGCATAVADGNWIQIDTGNSTACDLAPLMGKVIFLPVFDCTVNSGSQPAPITSTNPLPTACDAGNGSNTWYHISGWAKFYLSGYKVGGSQERASLVSGVIPCSGSDRCISGWFLDGVLHERPVAGPPTNQNYGTVAVAPAG
jgi:hypothetical protein